MAGLGPDVLLRYDSHDKGRNNSLDFVINCFFTKLFKTNNRDTVNYCCMQFNFELPSVLAQKRSKDIGVKYRACDNIFCNYV